MKLDLSGAIVCVNCEQELHPFDQRVIVDGKTYCMKCTYELELLREWEWWKNPKTK